MGADMASDHDVFQRRHFRKQANVLERAGNAGLGHFMNRGRLVGLAGKFKTAAVRRVKPGQHVEKRGLAGAIGSDQAIDLAAQDFYAHVAQGLQAAKAFGHTSDVEYCVCHVDPSSVGDRACSLRVTAVCPASFIIFAVPCRDPAKATNRAAWTA